jgi:hypothetical protein
MAWERRGERAYFYRTIRQDGGWRRVYYGTGPVGQFAAEVDALRRAENRAYVTAAQAARARLEEVITQTLELQRGCALFTSAVLLMAGYHRASRHRWRPWRNGRKALR